MEMNLHSPQRRLIELRMASADLGSLLRRTEIEHPADELSLRRLRGELQLIRDQIAHLEAQLDPPELA